MSWKKALLSVLVLGIAACGGPSKASNSAPTNSSPASMSTSTPNPTTAGSTPSDASGQSSSAPSAVTAGDQSELFAMERRLITPDAVRLPPTSPGEVISSRWSQVIRGSKIIGSTANSVTMYDAATGKYTEVKNESTAQPEESSTAENSEYSKAFIGTIRGSDYALASFPVIEPGTGTTPDSGFTEIFGFNTEKPTEKFSFRIPRGALGDQGDISAISDIVYNISGTHLILFFSSQFPTENLTKVYNLDTRRLTATYPGFAPGHIAGNTLLGYGVKTAKGAPYRVGDDQVTAKDLVSGKTLWTDLKYTGDPKDITFKYLSPTSTIITADIIQSTEISSSIRFINNATGKDTRTPITSGNTIDIECWPGEKDQSLCLVGESLKQDLVLLKTSNGELIRKIISGSSTRIIPDVTLFWKGVIYGSTDRGPVLINAITGKDVAVNPDFTPVYINEQFALLNPLPGMTVSVARKSSA
jgi:hypothetical protein